MSLRAAARILPLSVLLSLLACGGGGGGGGPTAPPPPSAGPSLVFTPGGTPGTNSVSLRNGAGSDGTTLFLLVAANQVTDVYGFAFDLSFPGNLLRYDGVVEGDFLSQAGSFATTLQVAENPVGNLVVGITRLGTLPGATGSGEVMTFQFTAIVSGRGSFLFQNNTSFDPDGSAQQGVSWIAGSVDVRL